MLKSNISVNRRESLDNYRYKYTFGGVTFEINSEAPLAGEQNCEKFWTVSDAEADYVISVAYADSEENPVMKTERDGNRITVYVSRKYASKIGPVRLLVSAKAANVFPEQDGFILHASYIVHEGRAILFTAPSGTGKSTQAEYWRQMRGAEIVNGDRVLITKRDGKFFANGIYAAGTSGICENVTAPIRNVVILEQGEINEIVPLRPHELFLRILCQCSFDMNSDEQYRKITALVSDLINTVPVSCYRCRLNPDSVEALERLLWKRI